MESQTERVSVKQEAKSQETQPTAEHLAKIFLFSYRLSQGNDDLQRDLFRFIHMIRPVWRVDRDLKDDIRKIATHTILRYVGSPLHSEQGKSKVDDDLEKQLTTFQSIMESDKDALSTRESSIEIGTEILIRDYNYLGKEGGRPRKSSGKLNVASPFADPWFSYFCYYVLMEKSIGIEEFDEMFDLIRKETVEHPEKFSRMGRVVEIYNQKHLDAPVVLPSNT